MRISDWSSDVCSSDLIRLEDVGADLVAPADIGLGRVLRARHRLALLQLALVEPRAEPVVRLGLVLVLRALDLALDDDAGGKIRDTHRRTGGVDVMTARARRAVGLAATPDLAGERCERRKVMR